MAFYTDYLIYISITIVSILSLFGGDIIAGKTINELHPLKFIIPILVPNVIYFLIFGKSKRFSALKSYVGQLFSPILARRREHK